MKMVGPSRNTEEKSKRKRLSPYARPGRLLEMGKMTVSDAPDALTSSAAPGVKSEDQVMLDESFGCSLTSNSAKPNPLTGPREEARQEQ
jgi:hypothetical protein